MQQKIVIRKKILLVRKKKYFEVPSNFFNPLMRMLKTKKNNIKLLSLYYPSNFEVNTLNIFQLIKKKNIKTLLPVNKKNNEMNFVEWRNLDPLNVNSFGMLEPSVKKKPQIPDLMLVPLLAFDRHNNRIGYGMGFYDKFLNKFLKKRKKILTIGVAFSFQKYNKLPVSNLDIKLDYILTEKGLI